MSHPSTFVGRAIEMQKLDQFLKRMLENHPQMVFLSGDPGSGKSRLIEEFLAKIKHDFPQIVTAVGYCNAYFGKTDPLLPFHDIADQLFTGSHDVARSQAARNLAKNAGEFILEIAPDAIGVFFPIVGPVANLIIKSIKTVNKTNKDSAASLSVKDPHSRAVIFEQFCRLLFRSSQDSPLILVLEDLHWADESTIEFLSHCARSWKSHNLMIIGTYRTNDLAAAIPEHPLRKVKRELIQKGLCDEITISKLSISEIQNWLSVLYPNNTFSAEFPLWLHSRTDGNAFFVSEILKDLQERESFYKDSKGFWKISSEIKNMSDLPVSIQAVLEQRISRLEQRLRDILACASVEGEEFTAQVISNVRKLNDDQVMSVLVDEIDRRHEIVSLKEERQIDPQHFASLFGFRNNLMKTYLYDALTPPQRRLLHQAVGEALEKLYFKKEDEIASALAMHFHESKNFEKALGYALMAATRAERAYDFNAAKILLRRAADYLPSLNISADSQADVWYRLGKAESLTGSFEAAEQCYLRSMDLIKSLENNDMRARLMSDLAYCYIQTDRSQMAISILTEAADINEKSGNTLQATHNQVQLAFAYHKGERQDLAKSLLTQASMRFESLGDIGGLADINRHLGINYRIEGDFEMSVKHLMEAIRLDQMRRNKFDESSDYTNLGSTYLMLRDDETTALNYYEKALELSRQISKIHEEGHVLLNISRLYALRMDWVKALNYVEEGLRLSELVQETSNVIRGHWYRGIIKFYQGQIGRAILDYDRALSLGIKDAHLRWGILYNLGSLRYESGSIQNSFQAYYEAAELLLNITQEMPVAKQVEFLKMQHKQNVFQALRFVADHSGQTDAISSLLLRLPQELSLDFTKPSPKFYWGGGKWV